MTKRPKVDGSTAILTGRLVRPAGSGPLPHDLPVAAWERLHRAKPGWASVTAVEVEELLASWLVFLQDKSLSKPEHDMRLEEALEQLEEQLPWGDESTPMHRGIVPWLPAQERLPRIESDSYAG